MNRLMEEPRNCQPSAIGFLAPTLCMGHLGSIQDGNLRSDRSDDVNLSVSFTKSLPQNNRLGVPQKYGLIDTSILLWWGKESNFLKGTPKTNQKNIRGGCPFFCPKKFIEKRGTWLSTSAGRRVGACAGTGDVFDPIFCWSRENKQRGVCSCNRGGVRIYVI